MAFAFILISVERIGHFLGLLNPLVSYIEMSTIAIRFCLLILDSIMLEYESALKYNSK